MPELKPTPELNTGFSHPEGAARPWAEVDEVPAKSELRGRAVLDVRKGGT